MTATSEVQHAKRIALTFDDVPRFAGHLYSSDRRTAELIGRLRDAGVPQAGFFVIVGNLHQPFGVGAERRIAQYVCAGHVIGNHSYTHLALSSTSVADYLLDIDKASTWLASRPGSRPWFRHPYCDEGDADPPKRRAVRNALRERGLENAYITVPCNDQHLDHLMQAELARGSSLNMSALGQLYAEVVVGSADFYHSLCCKLLGRAPAHVVLLHETDLNARFIDVVVTALRDGGWSLIGPDDAYRDPIATTEPAPGYGVSRVSGLCGTDAVYRPASIEELSMAFRARVTTQ